MLAWACFRKKVMPLSSCNEKHKCLSGKIMRTPASLGRNEIVIADGIQVSPQKETCWLLSGISLADGNPYP